MNENEQKTEQRKILRLYAACCAGLALSLVPTLAGVAFTLLLFLGVLIASYAMRRKAPEGSLAENHTDYIVRTIWLAGFFGMISVTIASIYMLGKIDNTPLEPCSQNLLSMGMEAQNATNTQMVALFKPCLDQYLIVNKQVLLMAALISAAPVFLYVFMRFTRGLARAAKGYRLANVKSWF